MGTFGPMHTILIVDDDKDLRVMLKYLIQTTTGMQVVGEAGDGLEAIDEARKLQPDLIIMDAAMPNLDGVEATRRIRDMQPQVYILGLTAFADYPETMLGAGANKCLLKTEAYGYLTNLLMQLKTEQESGSPGSRARAPNRNESLGFRAGPVPIWTGADTREPNDDEVQDPSSNRYGCESRLRRLDHPRP